MKTVLGFLDRQVQQRPDRAMLSDERETLTFSEVSACADRIGSALLKRGADREPVLVFMRRSGAMIAAFFGVWRASCFYVPVDAEMGETRIRSILERVNPRFAITDETASPLLSLCGFKGEALDADAILSEPADATALERAAEKTLRVLGTADEGETEMTLLLRQALVRIFVRIIAVEEDLSVLEDIESVE